MNFNGDNLEGLDAIGGKISSLPVMTFDMNGCLAQPSPMDNALIIVADGQVSVRISIALESSLTHFRTD